MNIRAMWIVAVMLVASGGVVRAAADNLPLSALHANWPEQKLSITLLEPADRSAERGSSLKLSITAARPAYFALLLADDRGGVRLILPSSDADNDQLRAGESRIFPDPDSNEALPADMVPGPGRVYVIASSRPVFAASQLAAIERAAAPIQSALGEALAKDAVQVTWDSTSLTVKDPAPRRTFVANDVVDYFVNRVRGPGAAMGLLVQFDFDSDKLQELGRRQLEQLGLGLNDPRLVGQRFVLEGHTDDIGPESYNKDLSARRAHTVLEYLVRQQAIDARRLTAVGVGTQDLVKDPDPEKMREKSRRVVIRRLDD